MSLSEDLKNLRPRMGALIAFLFFYTQNIMQVNVPANDQLFAIFLFLHLVWQQKTKPSQ